MILEAEADLEVIGEATNGLEAISEARRLRPDVVLMDVRMPELDGIEATRRLLAEVSGTKVVMLTTFDMDEYVYEALNAGASGFLLQGHPRAAGGRDPRGRFRRRAARSCDHAPGDRGVRAPPSRLGAARATGLAELTERESEVLKQIARGLSNAEIAKELFVSETTVKTHVARVLMKLRLRDRVQAVVFAYESGLVQPGDAEGAAS